jgi:hypothetical protein
VAGVTWLDRCSCGSTRFWQSRSGYKICMACYPCALAALACLGRRVPGGEALVEQWVAYGEEGYSDARYGGGPAANPA